MQFAEDVGEDPPAKVFAKVSHCGLPRMLAKTLLPKCLRRRVIMVPKIVDDDPLAKC